jgi:hypothetical protein
MQRNISYPDIAGERTVEAPSSQEAPHPTQAPDCGLSRRAALLWLLLALAVVLSYALATGQAWEDYYISFRHSAHLVEGKGLTYQEGQRIQGFTSPLATLLLAAGYGMGGSEPVALWLFRGLSAAAYAAGLWLLLGGVRRAGVAPGWLPLTVPGLVYLLDAKAAAFSMNGMETGLLLLFLGGSLFALAGLPGRGRLLLGLCWAGMMWTRPDSALYIAAMGLAAMLFLRRGGPLFGDLLRAAGVCTAAYLPWFAFAWIYYGSPVPHSVTAKGMAVAAPGASGLPAALRRLPEVWAYLYLPPYSEFSTWKLLAVGGGMAGLAASFYWAWPGGRPFGRAASWMTLCGAAFLALIPRVYPWYYPAVMACSLPALASMVADLSPSPHRRRRAIVAATALLFLAGLGWAWVDCARTVQVVQRVSEDGNREQIGRWLAANAAPSDRVYLECPGYIGYYSGLEMLDYPGLVSPPVVRARRLVADDFAVVGRALAPEWMVLRSEEVDYFRAVEGAWLQRNYRLATTFDVSDRLRQQAPEHPGILYDGTFHVLRRSDARKPGTEP